MRSRIKYSLLLILFLGISCISTAQLHVLSGTSVLIKPSTTLDFSQVQGTVKIDSNTLVRNNGSILLGSAVSIAEEPGFPIKGIGFEQFDSLLIGAFSALDVANLGLLLWGNSISGFSINRFHDSILDPLNNAGVNRNFVINSGDLVLDSVVLYCDTTELNTLSREKLAVLSFSTSGYFNHGQNFIHPQTSAPINVDSINILTLINYELTNLLSIDTLNCSNDTSSVTFTEIGFGNNGYYVLELSDSSGNFPGVYVDTVSVASDTFNFTFPTVIAGSQNYSLRVINISNSITSNSFPNISLFPYPIVTVTTTDSVLCSNGGIINLSGSPLGGIFNGSGVDTSGNFNPQLSGSGLFSIVYNYTNLGGCVGSDTILLTVNANPVTFFTGLLPQYCNNDSSTLLLPTPTGGVFSGPGISSSTFNPQVVFPGVQLINYTYTDTNNCSSVYTDSTIVNPIPLIPNINAVANILTCSETGDFYQWYFNGTILTNDTLQQVTGLTDGGYQVEVFNSYGCSSLSDTFNLLYYTLNENHAQTNVLVFPNPAVETITIKSNMLITKLEVHDMNGKISSFNYNQSETPLKLSVKEFATGIYILKMIFINETVMFQKLIINR